MVSLPDTLFHVTSKVAARNIGIHGLPHGMPWVRSDLAAYHARLLSEQGHTPLILSLPTTELSGLEPQPNWEAIQEPSLDLLDLLQKTSEAISHNWTKGEPTWQRSVDLVGSMVCGLPLPATYLKTHMPPSLFL